jgi:hypothetical protein
MEVEYTFVNLQDALGDALVTSNKGMRPNTRFDSRRKFMIRLATW